MSEEQSLNISRNDLVCPNCGYTGLEEWSAISSAFSGKEELYKATRCPKSDCKFHNGVPPRKIKEQLE